MLVGACASKPVLAPRSGGNPAQVDLSGDWVLKEGTALPENDEQQIRMPRRAESTSVMTQRHSGRQKRTKGSSVHVFLESGEALKVTQTDFGLFFSFDRAIVEEYNFGENIVVSVGPIEAQRVSGWDGQVFVVETMDSEGNVLAETWRLEDDGSNLVRDIAITEKGEPGFFSRQRFERR